MFIRRSHVFARAAVLALLVAGSAASSAAAAPPSTLVLFVGGIGSTPSSAEANFAPLVRELAPNVVARSFVYAGSTCQPIEDSAAELAAVLRDAQASHLADSAIVVGHSNGGVIALEAIAAAPDVAPFVRRVVTVDSPVRGLKLADALVYGATLGPCGAVDELYARHSTPGWSDYVAQLAQWERSIGVDVRAVVNPSDLAVSTDEQSIDGVDNYPLRATGTDWNHAAVLHAIEAVPQLAAIVTDP